MPPFACLKEGDGSVKRSVEERRKNKQCLQQRHRALFKVLRDLAVI